MEKLSLVIPCYNEEAALPLFFNEITKVAEQMDTYDFEFIFIDDGSTDNTLSIIINLSSTDTRIKYLSFSRNFGKEAALYAGLSHSTGDYIAIIDADLQDPPELLLEMISYIKLENYDCVATRRSNRKGEPLIRSYFATRFYKIINTISDTEIVDGARDFRLMKKNVVRSIIDMNEYNRFSKGLFSWVGFKTKWISYENAERIAGKTKWSFWDLFLYSLDGIIAFSTVPLAISSILGFFFFILALMAIIIIVLKTLVWGDPVSGWPTLACFIFLVGGIQLLCFGIMGQYLARTYLETKKRPIYLLKETNINSDY